jgi:hypothetical protein
MSELKSCPFCGATDIRIMNQGCDSAAHCWGCGARSAVQDTYDAQESCAKSLDESATSAWNTRALVKWMCISKAPRDGRPVLTTDGSNKNVSWYENGKWVFFKDYFWYPTHWMEIPAGAFEPKVPCVEQLGQTCKGCEVHDFHPDELLSGELEKLGYKAHKKGNGCNYDGCLTAQSPAPSVSGERVTEWQPIETAPRDGTKFRVRVKGLDIVTAEWRFHETDEFNQDCYRFETCGSVHTSLHMYDDEELEWHPLPKPPLVIVEGE